MFATWCQRSAVRCCLVLVVVFGLALLLAPVGMAAAAPANGDAEYGKYYVVTPSDVGKPQVLTDIAQRFLGSADRQVEIYNLNVGRQQPDGGTLSDPADLHASWALVLPWDAAGDGVQLGQLSTASPVNAAGKASADSKAGAKGGGKVTGTEGASRPTPAASTSNPAVAVPPATGSGGCETAATSAGQADWAPLRLAPDQAWSRSRGKGQVVAVIDSGVEGKLPELAGHVATGADIVTGAGRGDTDCLGTGTAIAGIVVAQPSQRGTPVGIAPDASVLPVRTVTTTPKAQPGDQVAAIQVAVSAGATVIALGSFIDLTNAVVADAVSKATAHNIVVVAGASTVDAPPTRPAAGVLRVGGVGMNGQPAAPYRPGAVDVVAPGLNVTVLGITGTGTFVGSGTQYAVGYVAGQAALVRAAYPGLTAAQVVNRIKETAERMAATAPDDRYGWGLISPGASVNRALDEQHTAAVTRSGQDRSYRSGGGTLAVVLVVVVGVTSAVLLAFRLRHMVLTRSRQEPHDRPERPGPARGAPEVAEERPERTAP